MGVPDRVRAALGDGREQGLRRERALDARVEGEAESGNAAHVVEVIGRSGRGLETALLKVAEGQADKGTTVAVSHPEPDPELTLELVAEPDPVEGEAPEVEEEPENAKLSDEERLRSADPLKLYVRQLGDGRLLTQAEERELARRKDLGDEDAKRKLVESNLRLVMSI